MQVPAHEGHLATASLNHSVVAAAGQVGGMAEGAVQILLGFHHRRARLGTGAAQHGALCVGKLVAMLRSPLAAGQARHLWEHAAGSAG